MADENPTETSTNPTTTSTSNESTLSAALSAAPSPAVEAPSTPKDPAAADSKPASVPEKYETWKVPEGYEIDATANEEASAVFKELGLSQEQGQKLVDFYAKHGLQSSKDAMDAWMAQRGEWRDSMKSDSVLGKLVGKDGNFGPDSPLVRTINQALNGLQDSKLVSDFKEAMNLTGAGDNPAFVRVLHAFASKLTEGTTYPTGGPANINPRTGELRGRPSAGAAIYPNLPSASGAG